eukprot:m.126447 g.126447  ORF g.126447 m.126447 type:complete len:120 (+) comp12994_c0_seq1:76-435(+)
MDPEVQKALKELQVIQQNTAARMQMADAQKYQKRTELRKVVLTAQEMEALPSDVTVYNAVGKMFVVSDKEAILDDLETQAKDCDVTIKKIEEAQKHMKTSLKQSEDNIREMLIQRHKKG